MPARPPRARGRPCPSCGADRWSLWGKKWQCRPCNAKRTARTNARRRNRPALSMLGAAKGRAKAAGAPFRLTVEDIEAVWPKNNRCPALGIPFVRGTHHRVAPGSPTLDRLNNDWGYEPGNIAVISMAANRAKGELTAEQLEQIAAWMRRQGLE